MLHEQLVIAKAAEQKARRTSLLHEQIATKTLESMPETRMFAVELQTDCERLGAQLDNAKEALLQAKRASIIDLAISSCSEEDLDTAQNEGQIEEIMDLLQLNTEKP